MTRPHRSPPANGVSANGITHHKHSHFTQLCHHTALWPVALAHAAFGVFLMTQ